MNKKSNGISLKLPLNVYYFYIDESDDKLHKIAITDEPLGSKGDGTPCYLSDHFFGLLTPRSILKYVAMLDILIPDATIEFHSNSILTFTRGDIKDFINE